MKQRLAHCTSPLLGLVGALFLLAPVAAAAADSAAATLRIEARSDDLLGVGLVAGDRMAIHLSRLVDNAPLSDAVLTVVLRGVVYQTTAEADGSYSMRSKDLGLPGQAAVIFQVTRGEVREQLKGVLKVTTAGAAPEDKNTVRQLAWWALNFTVCIAFLMLWSRRRKAAEHD